VKPEPSLAIAILIVAAPWAPRAAEPAEHEPATVWDGVYTSEQAARGQAAYAEPCGRCHGLKLNGAPEDPDFLPTPPIGGAKFLRNWDGRSLASLVEYTQTTMPAMNPGYLSDADVVDIVAFMLSASRVPPGPMELTADADELSAIVIEAKP
jgi:mono/diheme cytochrome c family protein